MWDIVEEHLEEAAFLASQWQRARHSPDYRLHEVAQGPEARLLAHLDGLACAGPEAPERLVIPWLESTRPEEVFVAALALMATGAPLDWLLPFFSEAPGPRQTALFRALRLAPTAEVSKFLRRRELQATPGLQAAALGLLSLRGEALEAEALLPLLRSESAEIKTAALRALREDLPAARPLLESALGAQSPDVRIAAGETALALGYPAALHALRRPVASTAPEAARVLAVLAAAGHAEDVSRMAAALDVPALESAALWALGHSGWRHAAELCLEAMKHDRTARLAGESFSRVTGLRLEGDFARPAKADEENGLPPLEEDDLDADLVPSPEATLPLPDATAVARWWAKEKDHFSPKTRYLRGQPLSPEVAWKALSTEPMRGREQLALDLAVQTQGAVRFDTRTWANRQTAALATGLTAVRTGRPRLTTR
ncbi:TIGR02270 family protein [Myxococcus llanfairpwllgwyngyllgogerychwyrndrobwllllantysiliogogogochensis]|nr:TIGR02270 family protein [Myxococcus llanfairpwllgwyngyllgogerychwyrndrobwllllantysiliogogogochensis]